MRTETLTRTLYTYGELPAPAQEKARDWYREGFDYPWAPDNRASLEAFCHVFPVRARDWSYDAGSADITPVFTGDDQQAGLQGRRLVAYLWNQFNGRGDPGPVFLRRRRYSCKAGVRLSHVFREETCCPFTGYHMDEVLLDPLRKFLRRPDGRCYSELLADCLWAWVRACRDDWSSLLEDEAVAETIEANGWEFTAEGRWAESSFRWPAAIASL